jgi:AcrR family transcriptional regulator
LQCSPARDHEASIADICARARIARGTLYQYFKDKRAVLAALIDRIVSRFIDAVRVVFADADTATLILRMARGTGFAREALARIDEQVVGAIEADFRAAMDRGVVRSFEPHVVAQFIVGGIEKIVVDTLDTGRAPDVARVTREIAVLSCGFLPGTRPRPLRGPLGRSRGRT